jgi:hypothetical protein
MNAGALTVQMPLGTPTVAGALVVVAIQHVTPGTITSVTDNASAAGTYVAIPSAQSVVGAMSDGMLEIWYATANDGATSITTMASANIGALVVWQFTTPRPVSIDAAAVLNDQPATKVPNAPAIMTATPGEIVVAALLSHNAVTGITSGSEFTDDELVNQNGSAHLTDPLAPAGVHVAQWNSGLDVYCASAVAFAVH